MRLVIVADVFPPLRSSGAVQLRDLSIELVRQGHDVSVVVASSGLDQTSRIEEFHGVRVVRLRTPRTKDVNWVRRSIGESLMPYILLWRLRRSGIAAERWDGIIWYSPTIFLGPVVKALKWKSNCKGYLIVRDIFPDWAVDVGLMRRGLPYLFFRAVAQFQYSVADVIGIQTPGNRCYFQHWAQEPGKCLEVLHNWLAQAPNIGCSVDLDSTHLAGRKLLVYAGNMGVAQNMHLLMELAERMRARADVGFVFVGRGSAVGPMKEFARQRRLDNVIFFDEVEPSEIPGLYAQCAIGLVALDSRHRTHNIPGKFLSYLQSGLPVLAAVNAGNDIVELIRKECVGQVCTDGLSESLAIHSEQLLTAIERDAEYPSRCRALAERLFSVEGAARQVSAALSVRFA